MVNSKINIAIILLILIVISCGCDNQNVSGDAFKNKDNVKKNNELINTNSILSKSDEKTSEIEYEGLKLIIEQKMIKDGKEIELKNINNRENTRDVDLTLIINRELENTYLGQQIYVSLWNPDANYLLLLNTNFNIGFEPLGDSLTFNLEIPEELFNDETILLTKDIGININEEEQYEVHISYYLSPLTNQIITMNLNQCNIINHNFEEIASSITTDNLMFNSRKELIKIYDSFAIFGCYADNPEGYGNIKNVTTKINDIDFQEYHLFLTDIATNSERNTILTRSKTVYPEDDFIIEPNNFEHTNINWFELYPFFTDSNELTVYRIQENKLLNFHPLKIQENSIDFYHDDNSGIGFQTNMNNEAGQMFVYGELINYMYAFMGEDLLFNINTDFLGNQNVSFFKAPFELALITHEIDEVHIEIDELRGLLQPPEDYLLAYPIGYGATTNEFSIDSEYSMICPNGEEITLGSGGRPSYQISNTPCNDMGLYTLKWDLSNANIGLIEKNACWTGSMWIINQNEFPDYCIDQNMMLGDVSGNGIIETFDAALILQYVTQGTTNIGDLTTEQLIAADVDCNGIIEAYDSSWILLYFTGLTDDFPCNNERYDNSEIEELNNCVKDIDTTLDTETIETTLITCSEKDGKLSLKN